MNILPDSLGTGLPFLLCGSAAVLATLPERYRIAEWLVTYLFIMFLGAPLAGLDIPVPWPPFSEICVAAGLLFVVTALARYARKELAEGEYD